MFNTRAISGASRAVAVFAAAALVAGAAIAPAGATTFDPTEAKAKASSQSDEQSGDKEKRYCVVSKVSTGTILPRRTCKTRDQWIKSDGFDPIRAQ